MKKLFVNQKFLYILCVGILLSFNSHDLKANNDAINSTFYTVQSITGKVVDSDGLPLIGVNVLVKGTDRGTITDIDGSFTLDANPGDVLEISYLGYTTQEIVITNQTMYNVTMGSDRQLLDEVVVVGYGSRKKSDITGAVSTVKSEEINAFPVLDATQALQGRAAGVVVQSNNGGEPGAPIAIKVRGNTSIGANSAPLIVVDGFVGASMPQPGDIESMEVLKDASATAIYGSRGSGGVVLVTTKKGKSGDVTVELSTNFSVQQNTNELDLLDADQFATYQQSINPAYEQGTGNTDWQDEIYRGGYTANHQASFSGGTDKVNYYASGNYFFQEGIVVNSDFERITFLSNIEAQATDKLKLGMNLYGSRGTQNGVLTQSTGETANGGGDDVIGLALRFSPDSDIFNEDGTFTQSNVGDGIENPWAVANELRNETKSDRFRLNVYGSYDILDNLTFKSTFGSRTLNENVGAFKPQTFVLTNGFASLNNRRSINHLSENYLTYNTGLGRGDLTLLGGYSYQINTTTRFGALTEELLSDDFLWYNLAAGQLQTRRITSSFSESEIQSQFARVNYDFDDKYLLTATVRRDGASNFATNNKHAIFPSAAFGWIVSNENFLKDNNTISNLKLRASYGVTGNQAISPYQSLAELKVTPATEVGVDPGVSVAQEPNPDLKWESSYQTNIGIDVGIIENRFSASFDFYNIATKDLLLQATTTPIYSGATDLAVFQNIGEIKNSGFEISLNSRNIVKGNLRWTTDFNLSSNKSEVVALINGADIIGSAAPGYFAGKDTYILREGEAIGVFWGQEYRGVFQGGDLPAGTALVGQGEAGDPLFTDVDGDGTITTTDNMIIGDPNPTFTWGMNNNISYGSFDVNIFFQGAQGGDILNLTNVQLFNGDSNSTTDVLNAWTPDNTGSDIPRNVASRGREISSRFVEDGSYVRLKNLSIGYSLSSALTDRLNIGDARITLGAQNLLTFTSYSGLDPEVSYFGSGGQSTGEANVVQGHDFGNYPTIRSITFGLNVKF